MSIFEDLYSLMMTPITGVTKIADDEVGGIRVSTVLAGDINQYETALCDANGAHPVQRYDSEEEAMAGHREWIAKVPGLTTVRKLGYGTIVDDKIITLDMGKTENPSYQKDNQ